MSVKHFPGRSPGGTACGRSPMPPHPEHSRLEYVSTWAEVTCKHCLKSPGAPGRRALGDTIEGAMTARNVWHCPDYYGDNCAGAALARARREALEKAARAVRRMGPCTHGCARVQCACVDKLADDVLALAGTPDKEKDNG